MATVICDKNRTIRVCFSNSSKIRKTIYLGKCPKKEAEAFKYRVENLTSARIQGRQPSGDDAEWIMRLSPDLRQKLVKADLIDPFDEIVIPTLKDWVDSYIESRKDIKKGTVDLLTDVRNKLVEFWGEKKLISHFTSLDAANFRIFLLSQKKNSEATARGCCRKAKQFFSAAIKSKLIKENPFVGVPTADRVNKDRQRFITHEQINRVIEACPGMQWKLIFAFARYGGIRIPSELFGLKWEDILWDSGRIIIHSPKTEHHEGRDKREVPLFPELEPYLVQALELAEPNQKHIITMYNKENANLGTQARRIIRRAGFEPWPKTFQNLRSSRETELVEDFPVHVVTAWLGNTPKVAEKHYLQVTEEHFRRASGTARNTAQHMPEKESSDSQGGERQFSEKAVSADVYEALQVLANFCINKDLHLAPRVGFEPTT